MKNDRLFEILYLLLEKRTLTAQQLANHFEVSVRTIYRDIDTLSLARIPIYTNKGKNGGISIMDHYTLSRTLLNDQEKESLLIALKATLDAGINQSSSVMDKLSGLFQKNEADWIQVDFTQWSYESDGRDIFEELKVSILERFYVEFDYYNTGGVRYRRRVEPLKLYFKAGAWYLYAFCLLKKEMRFFKLTRIKNLEQTKIHFEREIPSHIELEKPYYGDKIHVKLKISASCAFRVFDEFQEFITLENGDFLVEIDIPDQDWILSYLMSFGNQAEVIEPKELRDKIIQHIHAIEEVYHNDKK